jgi:hypothetical protein
MKKTVLLSLGFILVAVLAFFAGFRFAAFWEERPMNAAIPAPSVPAPGSGTAGDPDATESSPAPSSVPGDEGLKLVRVATITGETANEEFRRNVQIMQLKKQRVEQLQRERLAAEGTEEAARIGRELEQASADLIENNRRMVQTYGFSLDRDYVYVIESSTLKMKVAPGNVDPVN